MLFSFYSLDSYFYGEGYEGKIKALFFVHFLFEGAGGSRGYYLENLFEKPPLNLIVDSSSLGI